MKLEERKQKVAQEAKLIALKISLNFGIHPTLSAPKQVPSLSSGRKRKTQELEPEVRIPGLECNRSLPKGVNFVNNNVIDHLDQGSSLYMCIGDDFLP
ncbi:hypothetical protein Tco_0856794 [Tanacetum coccineum]|uniref:Uncharacterized protein n=1 Tax=Tanacetum coccineum TaxID=301880 RepID=A0ABQ5B6H7_9ASTR